jgi:hypothetical protein
VPRPRLPWHCNLCHPGSAKEEIKQLDTLSGIIEPELSLFTTVASEETTENITWEKDVEVT